MATPLFSGPTFGIGMMLLLNVSRDYILIAPERMTPFSRQLHPIYKGPPSTVCLRMLSRNCSCWLGSSSKRHSLHFRIRGYLLSADHRISWTRQPSTSYSKQGDSPMTQPQPSSGRRRLLRGYNSSFGCCPKAEYSAGPTYSGKGLWTLQIVWFVARLMNLQNTSSSTARLQFSSGMLLGSRHLKTTIQISCIVLRSYPIALTNSTMPLSLYAAGHCGKEGTVSYSGTSTRAWGTYSYPAKRKLQTGRQECPRRARRWLNLGASYSISWWTMVQM